ncbi:MAG: hypothetical protein KI790_00130 [Cyclobacteriaceae bacterium]|nr:hypothetical protein [Cyclobacteriaceae bacterium HetDA_MAG_MS6]
MKTHLMIKVNSLFLLFALIGLTISGCSDDEKVPDPEIDESQLVVRNLSVISLGDQPDASAVTVVFDAAEDSIQVLFYQIMIQAAETPLDLEKAELLQEDRFLKVQQDQSNYEIILPASLPDTDGNTIEVGRNYQAYVLSISEIDREVKATLSTASNVFQLITYQSLTVEAPSVSDIADLGTPADITVSFNAPINSSYISSFRLFILKQANNIDVTTALSTPATQYLEVTNSQSSYNSKLPGELLDTDGDDIVAGSSYKLAILSMYQVGDTEGAALSPFSGPFVKQAFDPYRVTTILSSFGSNDGLDAIKIGIDGNFYVSNFGRGSAGRQLFQITPEGIKTDFATVTNTPLGLVTAPNGDIFITNENRIDRMETNGTVTPFVEEEINFGGLVMDENQNIYCGNYRHQYILRINVEGLVDTIASHDDLVGTVGIAYHEPSASLFTGNFDSGKIHQVSLDGTVTEIADLTGIGYLTEMNGYLYATLFTEHKIAKVSLTGEDEIIAGTGKNSQKDGPLLLASFDKPNGIIGDAATNTLYMTEWGKPRVTKITLPLE